MPNKGFAANPDYAPHKTSTENSVERPLSLSGVLRNNSARSSAWLFEEFAHVGSGSGCTGQRADA